jgi:ferrous iron transport protein A
MLINLTQLPTGQRGKIDNILLAGKIRHRILDLGFTPGTMVESVRRSPLGDPVAYQVRGTVIALRSEESSQITVDFIREEALL